MASAALRADALATAGEDSLRRVADWLDEALDTLAEEERPNEWSAVRRELPPLSGDEP